MKPITDISQIDPDGTYTYADYLTWQFKERVELILGKIRKMTPSASLRHQKVSGALFREISMLFKGKPCQIFHPPFDVRLFKNSINDQQILTVVQPDLTVVCDERKLDQKGCLGAPDLVIEILSPSSATKDLKEKYALYEEAGIKEYWVVEPFDGIVNIFIMDTQGKYVATKPYVRQDMLESKTIPGLVLNLQEIFPEVIEEPEEPYGEKVERI